MVVHPEEFRDTDPRAIEVWIKLLRDAPPGDKLLQALDLSAFALQLCEAGVRSRHPQASDREVFLRVAASHLPRDLMIRAYGWDPGAES